MDHALRCNLFDGPDVGGVAGAKELVCSPLTPSIKTPFVVGHEILSRKQRVYIEPNDGLGEVEAGGLQDRRIVGAICVPTPNVKGASRFQDTGDVAEPGVQQAVKLLLGHEIVDQGAILGTQ